MTDNMPLVDKTSENTSEEHELDIEVGGMAGGKTALKDFDASANITVVTDLDAYDGSTLEEKIDALIQKHSVVVISKSYCAFCRDVKELFASRVGVKIHIIEINEHPDGSKIHDCIKKKTGQATVPVVFIRGNLIGGCDDIKTLHVKGDLELVLLKGLINRPRTIGTDKLETSHLLPVERSRATHPLFWFPNTVNNLVIRVVGFQVCTASVLSAVFLNEMWARYLAAAVLVDFCLRFVAGSAASPFGMVATVVTSPFRPDFRPGPPKQFASLCGIMFSGLGTLFYFVEFSGHQYVGCAFMAGLAGASGLEWTIDFCLGCKFFAIGIYMNLIPDHVYRIYTSTRQEVEDSWDYMFLDSGAAPPETYDADPSSPIALRYKKKSDEWSKDDFDLIRHMQVNYFAMPLGLSGLAAAFKIASNWSDSLAVAAGVPPREYVAQEAWSQVFALIAAVVFVVFLSLYAVRAIKYPHKIATEYDCPLRSPGFGTITINLMLFAFLLYDEINYYPVKSSRGNEEPPQVVARVFFWIGAIAHSVLTVAKLGEWIARRMELEHIHAQWMIMPVGLSVAALVAPVIPMFAADSDHAGGEIFIARFFQSFALFMWIVLFTITFFKVVTTHNSDTRVRHGIFIWVAAPAVLGMSDFMICHVADFTAKDECIASFSNFYFIAIFIFLGLVWASLPHNGFLGQDKWGMSYWIGCFALDALAAAAALFYAVTDFNAAQTLMFIGLTMAAIANVVNFLFTMTGIVRRRGVFTPENKWGPLSFMKLTHEAFRGNMNTMKRSLEVLDITDTSDAMKDNLNMFAAHLNRLCIVHDEHSKHEDQIIFKAFNDYFHNHALKFNQDHDSFHVFVGELRGHANILLNTKLVMAGRLTAMTAIKDIMPGFFADFELHLKGEEDNLNPIGKKHIPLELQKQISRDVWNITSAEHWEIVIPYVVNNLPRHPQRVRYLKVLLWSLPERAHQIGRIVYRNVDAVTWENLRVEIPEMIPRGVPNYRRYY